MQANFLPLFPERWRLTRYLFFICLLFWPVLYACDSENSPSPANGVPSSAGSPGPVLPTSLPAQVATPENKNSPTSLPAATSITAIATGLIRPSPASLPVTALPTTNPLPSRVGPSPSASLETGLARGNVALLSDGHLILVKIENGTNREITDLGNILADNSTLTWSPEGSWFLLNEFNRKLTLIDLEGKKKLLLDLATTGDIIGGSSWSSGGKYFVFERIPAGNRARETKAEIWVADLSDPSKPDLHSITKGFSPAFSPDGRNIAFLTYARNTLEDGKVLNNTINLISVDGKQSRQVLDVDQLPEYHSPADGQPFELKPSLFFSVGWSIDGRNLIFNDGANFLASVATTGGKVRVWWYNTAKEAGRINYSVWNGRSDKLLLTFIPEADKNKPRVSIVDSAGKSTPLPGEHRTCLEGSPDGSLVAVGSNKELSIIRTVDQQITGTARTGSCPAWSPDGAWLVTGQEGGPETGKNLQIFKPDGSNLRTVASFNPSRQLKIIGWEK